MNLDKLNNERVVSTRKCVAEVLCELSELYHGNEENFDIKIVAKNISKLESAIEELDFACSHFNWNSSVCLQLDEAVNDLGLSIAGIVAKKQNIDFNVEVKTSILDASIKLSKALGTLVCWFDED